MAAGPIDFDSPPVANGVATHPELPPARPLRPSEIAEAWRSEGQLVRVPTGFRTLDEACRGGLPIPWRLILVGAPSAGKTALALVLAMRFAFDGDLCVGVLGVDEEPDDLNVRIAQMSGYTVGQCEARDPVVLDEMARKLSAVRIRFYDASHTIEAAADHLAAWAAEENRRAALVLDSLQTVRAIDSTLAKGAREHVDINLRALRAKGTQHRLLVVGTSEANRGSYRDDDAAERTNDMAAGKESGSIEFSAQTLVMLRTPRGHADHLHVRVPKNRRGAKAGFEFWLRLDRDRHELTECSDPSSDPGTAEERERQQCSSNKRALERRSVPVLRIIARNPGIGTRDLRTKMQTAGLKIGNGSLDAVLEHLRGTGRVVNRPAQKGEREFPHYFAIGETEADG